MTARRNDGPTARRKAGTSTLQRKVKGNPANLARRHDGPRHDGSTALGPTPGTSYVTLLEWDWNPYIVLRAHCLGKNVGKYRKERKQNIRCVRIYIYIYTSGTHAQAHTPFFFWLWFGGLQKNFSSGSKNVTPWFFGKILLPDSFFLILTSKTLKNACGVISS